MRNLIVFILTMLLSGCCYFMPCHPATRAVGYVTDLKGQPIKGATVNLYNSERHTNPEGCFAFDVAEALPFRLSAGATGFKDVEAPSKAGFFIIEIKMAPADSTFSSEVTWKEVSYDDYLKAKKCT